MLDLGSSKDFDVLLESPIGDVSEKCMYKESLENKVSLLVFKCGRQVLKR